MPTSPGTEMKVTPEMDVPIIPKAIRYQGELRFAVKKDALSPFFAVKYPTLKRIRKYMATTVAVIAGVIILRQK